MRKTLIFLLTLTTVFALTGCSYIKNTVNSNGSNSMITEVFDDTEYEKETYVYKEAYGVYLELDIIYPLESSYEDLPVVVYIHGGGYQGGTRDAGLNKPYFWYVNKQFLEAGYVLVTIDYTVSNEEIGTNMEDCFTDSKDAIRWLNKNEDMLGIDSSNIGLFGTSAGGGIVTMLGYTDNDDFIGDPELSNYPSDVTFVINFYGGDTRYGLSLLEGYTSYEELPEDLMNMTAEDGYRTGTSKDMSYDEMKERLEVLSCLTYVDMNATPTISFHGTEDPTVHYSSSIMVHDELESLGVINELYVIEGMGHGFETKLLSDEERVEYAQYAFNFGTSQYNE